MIAEAVMTPSIAKSAMLVNRAVAELSIDAARYSYTREPVLGSKQLLTELGSRGVKNADIARVLKIDPAGVTRLMKGERQLLLDEAIRLIEGFELESGQTPLPSPISRLVVRYIAEELRAKPSEEQLAEIAEDVRAFCEFARDPKVQQNLEAAETFFRAMRYRRPGSEKAAPPETDPHPAK